MLGPKEMKELSFDVNNVHVNIDKVDVVKFTEANEPKPTPHCPFRKRYKFVASEGLKDYPCVIQNATQVHETFEMCMKEKCAAWNPMYECCRRL